MFDYLSLDKRLVLVVSLVMLTAATVLWYWGSVAFLRESAANPCWAARWLGLNGLAVPLFAFAFFGLYHHYATWWVIEFPYWLISIVVSWLFFRGVLKVEIGWRELVSAGLIVVIAFLLAGGRK